MAGVINLAQPGMILPALLLLDTSILVLRATGAARTASVVRLNRVNNLFGLMRAQRCIPAVASTSLHELFHVVVRTRYEAALSLHRADLVRAFPRTSGHSWQHLYKLRPDLMHGFVGDLLSAR